MSRADRILRRLEKEDTEALVREKASRKGARLMVIQACCNCVHSRTSSACFHPKTPGRKDQWGNPPHNDGSTADVLCSRSLPPVPKGQGGFPEYMPPPDWCPLPLAAE